MPYMFLLTVFNNENDWEYRKIYTCYTEDQAILLHEETKNCISFMTSTNRHFNLSDVMYIDGENPVDVLQKVKWKAKRAGYHTKQVTQEYIKDGHRAYALRIYNNWGIT